MASSGKKGKKTKGKTLALNDFLQETPGTTPTIPIRKSNINWADEVEDNYDQYESSRPKTNVVLPTAPKSARGFDEFNERIPQHPPYNAYITNLPYDVREEEIAEFFKDLKIASMRIPKDERPGEVPRLKGYGYVEFEDREGLIGALSIADCTLKNRRIRIEVADNSDNERKRGGRMDNNRDRSDRSDVTSGDWRSRPRTEPPEPERNRGGFNRDRERDSNAGERDRGGSWRDSTDRPTMRDSDRARDGYGDRNRFSDGEKRGFGPRRGGDRDDKEGFTRGNNRDEPDKFESKTRPKLVLARRTIPLATDGEPAPQETVANPVPASSNQSSIFGRAKPVDTSIRERQIEDRLAKLSEKSATDRDNKRDGDRRDRGRRDDDSRWGRDRRKDSPIRRNSPEYRNNDYDRRSDSPDRRYSPDRRRRSSPDYRRHSRERRRSPDISPERRRSPDGRRGSPVRRRDSPDRRRRSPGYRRNSRDRRRSPDVSPRRRNSPDYGRNSPDFKREDGPDSMQRRSPEHRRSPDYKRSPDRRRDSPEHRKRSPDRSQPARVNQRRNDDRDKRGPNKPDRPQKTDKDKVKKEDKPHKENLDREMPKIKEPETPNFVAHNKYSFLVGEEELE